MVRVRMAVGAVVDPGMLLAPESHEADRPGERSIPLALGIFKLHADGVRWSGLYSPASVTSFHRGDTRHTK